MHVQFIAPKASGEDGAGQVPEALQENTEQPDPRELKEIMDPRIFRDLLDPKAPRELRAIQANDFNCDTSDVHIRYSLVSV